MLTLLLPDDDDPAGPDCAAYVDGLAAGLAEIGVSVRRLRAGAVALAELGGPVVMTDAAVGSLAAGAVREAVLRRAAVLVLRPLPHGLAMTPLGAALRGARWVAGASAPLQAVLLRELPGIAADELLLPGSAPAPQAAGHDEAGCHLLSLGAPGTLGHQAVLIEALSRLGDLEWRLVIEAAPGDVGGAALDAAIASHGLGERVRRVEAAEWGRADCFVRACQAGCLSTGALEALRRGIPLALAAPVSLAPPQVGVVAPMGDAEALSRSLRRIVCDQRLRRVLANGAAAFGSGLPDWATQARRVVDRLN